MRKLEKKIDKAILEDMFNINGISLEAWNNIFNQNEYEKMLLENVTKLFKEDIKNKTFKENERE